LSQLNLLMMALKPLDSPPVVHHETASTGVALAASLQVVAPLAALDAVGVAELEEHAATRAATEITARIRRDMIFTDSTSLTLDEPIGTT
jgi:hypothetical protein